MSPGASARGPWHGFARRLLWSFVSEWHWHADNVGPDKLSSAATPLSASRGLRVIDLPRLWWTLFGRFSMRRETGSDRPRSGSATDGRLS
jgi:hypothetical protein